MHTNDIVTPKENEDFVKIMFIFMSICAFVVCWIPAKITMMTLALQR
jgi:hypothetical protein